MGTEGEWAHEGRCLPKMKRPRDRVPCGKGGSLDGTPDDVYSQGIGRDGRPRPVRLQVVGLAYYDSGKVVLETGRSESADTTMRLLRRVYAEDILEVLDTDWGSGFTRAVGKRRGVLASPLMEQVQRLTERYGTRVDQKPVRKAWLKPVESFSAQKKRIDREHEFYIGDSEEEKKIAWKHALANAHRLSPPEERAPEIQRLGELHNNTERPVLGGLTPSAYHEEHRGKIRRPDPEELDFLCSVFIGTRIVKRDGVHLDHLDYGGVQDEVYALQGRKLFVWKPTEEKPPFLWLCDADGRPLAIATCSGLENGTLEDVARTRARVKRLERLTREVVDSRRFLIKGRRASHADHTRVPHGPSQRAPEGRVPGGRAAGADRRCRVGRRGSQSQGDGARATTRRALQAGVGAEPVPGSEPVKTGLELLSARARERPEPAAETECLADRLRRFAHAG